jgi:hypothetical protein
MTNRMMKAALALTAVGAMALQASEAAAGTSKTESAILGALLGGVAGAAVGNGRGEAVALGAVAGAALGVAVDKNNDRPRYRSAYRYRQSAYDGRYGRDGYGRGDRAYYDRGGGRYGYAPYRYDSYGYGYGR